VQAQSALSLWGDIFEQLFESHLGSQGVFSLASVVEFFKAHGVDEELLPLLDPIMPFKVEDSELTAGLTSAARYARTNELIVNLLSIFVGKLGKAVFAIDDLHWCDMQSLIVLTDAVKIEGVFFMFSARKNEKHNEFLESLISQENVAREELEPGWRERIHGDIERCSRRGINHR